MIIIRKRPQFYKGNIIELNIYDRFIKSGQGCNCSATDHIIMVDDKQLIELYKSSRLDGELKQYVEEKLINCE